MLRNALAREKQVPMGLVHSVTGCLRAVSSAQAGVALGLLRRGHCTSMCHRVTENPRGRSETKASQPSQGEAGSHGFRSQLLAKSTGGAVTGDGRAAGESNLLDAP